MKITIKHNIKREGCTLSGQILDCQFLDGAKRGDGVRYFNKNNKLFLSSVFNSEIDGNKFFVWGSDNRYDLDVISYTYPTEQAAQDMLDFINTFVEKDETVQEEPKEKRYKIVESPDGKTLSEMVEIISKALYETNPECYCVHPVSSYPCPTEMQERRSDWKNVDAIAKSRVLIHADEVIKALLGRE